MRIVPSIDATVASIPDSTLQAGVDWFPRCRADLRRAAAAHAPRGVGQKRAAAIFAALSPRLQWQVNWDAMIKVMKAASLGATKPPDTGLIDAREKAWRIAQGEHPADVLRGPKVTRFWKNLAGDDDPVTVDVWMMRAAGFSGDEAPSKSQYAEIEGAVQMAAGKLGIAPCGLQAAIWMHVRPPKPKDPWSL